MNQQEALRRLEALEAQARVSELERSFDDPEMLAEAERWAQELDVHVSVVIDESMAIARRIAEVGKDAYDRETAERYGMTVEAWRARDLEAELREWKEFDRKRRAQIVHWRQGVMYRGGVPVTD